MYICILYKLISKLYWQAWATREQQQTVENKNEENDICETRTKCNGNMAMYPYLRHNFFVIVVIHSVCLFHSLNKWRYEQYEMTQE